jgi:hypothetical protein
VWHTVHHG